MAYSVEETAQLLGIGKTLAYELVVTNRLPVVRLGRRVLVPRTALEEFIDAATEQPRDRREDAAPAVGAPEALPASRRKVVGGRVTAGPRRPPPPSKNVVRPIGG
jgi:excisionase family DNA binding protein